MDSTVRGFFDIEPPPIFPDTARYEDATEDSFTLEESANTPPPKLFLHGGAAGYIEQGFRHLTAYADHENMEEYITPTSVFVIPGPADVWHPTLMSIIAPVELAAKARYSIDMYLTDEEGRDIRPDIAFSDQKGDYIMVFCNKPRGYLRPEDFQTLDRKANEQDIENAIQEASKQKFGTSIQAHNARLYSKEAVAWKRKTRCRYVVLFDWDTMVFMRFPRGSPGKDGTNAVREDRLNCPKVLVLDHHKRTTFRRCLLGFLLEACDAVDATPAGDCMY